MFQIVVRFTAKQLGYIYVDNVKLDGLVAKNETEAKKCKGVVVPDAKIEALNSTGWNLEQMLLNFHKHFWFRSGKSRKL